MGDGEYHSDFIFTLGGNLFEFSNYLQIFFIEIIISLGERGATMIHAM